MVLKTLTATLLFAVVAGAVGDCASAPESGTGGGFTHLPDLTSQKFPGLHWDVSLHFVAHMSATQAKTPHEAGETLTQPPSPSHTAPGVPNPSMHEAIPHVVSLPTKLVQAVALVPSHVRLVQTFAGSDWLQPGRVPAGIPVMVPHVPSMPDMLQA